ncbi:DUF5671 domain-containing protein [Thermomicrobium sp. CFH 73360]|uniref:DUF5671 domain-containing protein n=1 Tax=Thermomicrobium sp. CFH 73360 TaxID=2951987 RepID=UPI0020778B3F|nr:DUF5671 domain-containing protein [Thermomicrobium sp. CFH 73360]
MAIARRLYLYLVVGIALAVWATGTVRLLRALFFALWEFLAQPATAGDPEAFRRQLSVSVALLVVAFPIWAVHWWLLLREIAADPTERRSALRSLFLTLVLLVTFGFWLSSGVELLRLTLLGLLGVADSMEVSVPRALEELALLLVTGALWLGHARLARAERRIVSLEGAADWLLRLYGYGAAATGLTLLVVGIANLLQTMLDVLLTPVVVTGTIRFPLAAFTAFAIGGLVAWGLHWGEALRLVTGAFPAAERERHSLVRWTYLGLAVFAGLAGLLVALAASLNAILRWMLGVPDGETLQRLRQLLSPWAWAIPLVLVWWYHRVTMQREAAVLARHPRVGPDWALGVTRLLVYLSTFAGLLLAVLGTGGLVGLLLRALVAAATGTTLGNWREDLAFTVSLSVVGGAAWLALWREVALRTLRQPEAERTSLSRRVYLYGTLGLSVLALLGTAGYVVYQLVSWLFGLLSLTSALSDAAPAFGFTLVALGVLISHLIVLMHDARAIAARPVTQTVRLVLRLPPESDVDAVVRELADHLPPGAALERAT